MHEIWCELICYNEGLLSAIYCINTVSCRWKSLKPVQFYEIGGIQSNYFLCYTFCTLYLIKIPKNPFSKVVNSVWWNSRLNFQNCASWRSQQIVLCICSGLQAIVYYLYNSNIIYYIYIYIYCPGKWGCCQLPVLWTDTTW